MQVDKLKCYTVRMKFKFITVLILVLSVVEIVTHFFVQNVTYPPVF